MLNSTDFLSLVGEKGVGWRHKAARNEIMTAKYDVNDAILIRYKDYLLKKNKDEYVESAEFMHNTDWFRRQIESLILIGYPDSEISESFSVPEPTIFLYRKIFFDIPENMGNLLREYIAENDEDEDGRKLKRDAVKLGKNFMNYWILKEDKNIDNIEEELSTIKKSLLIKLKEVDKIKFGSKAFRDMMKAYEILCADINKKRDISSEEKSLDILSRLATSEPLKFAGIKDLKIEKKEDKK